MFCGGSILFGHDYIPPFMTLCRIMRTLFYILNFILCTLAFRDIMRGNYNRYIRFFVTGLLFILLMVGLGFLLDDSIYYFGGSIYLIVFMDNLWIYIVTLTRVILISMLIMQFTMLAYGIKKAKDRDNKKWLYITCFVPIIGSILYFCIGRNKNILKGKKEE